MVKFPTYPSVSKQSYKVHVDEGDLRSEDERHIALEFRNKLPGVPLSTLTYLDNSIVDGIRRSA